MKPTLWLARKFRKLTGRRPREAPPTPASEAQRASTAGDAARDQGNFAEAVLQYSMSLSLAPDNTPIRVQLGHVLKDAARLAEAEAAYRAATVSDPGNAETFLHLGHVLKLQGRVDEAIDAYAASLAIDESSKTARNELVAIGGRHRLPGSQYGRSAVTDGLSKISRALGQNIEAIRDWVDVSTFPVEAYDRFRATFPIQPAPSGGPSTGAPVVLIEAMTSRPVAVRMTLTALLDQRDTDWTAIVRASADMLEHSVASMAAQDPRIHFSTAAASDLEHALPEGRPVIMMDAGTVLDREAIGWLRYAAARTNAELTYADHDHHMHDWRLGPVYVDPALQGAADAWDIATTPEPPAVLFASASTRHALQKGLTSASGPEQRRRVLLSVLESKTSVAHLPRILSSIRVEEAPAPSTLHQQSFSSTTPAAETEKRILVVIPTRDEPEMLDACLHSLRNLAARNDLLDIVVIDNRSTLASTQALLKDRVESGDISVLAMDEPFNWARFNNMAVTKATQQIFVFANNDLEILTANWDDRLRQRFEDPSVGIVGARLLYPDRTIQHAGVMMGAGANRPVHEGLGSKEADGGPLDRWRRLRQAAAVTGAFMAVDRTLFESLAGFNERLAIGYNDIDLCLQARASNRAVLYDPSIEAIHYESKTRGRNDEGSKTAWDNDELADLYKDWGDWIFADPGKNPHWASAHSRAFDGYRDLSLSQVLRGLDESASDRPWSISVLRERKAGIEPQKP